LLNRISDGALSHWLDDNDRMPFVYKGFTFHNKWMKEASGATAIASLLAKWPLRWRWCQNYRCMFMCEGAEWESKAHNRCSAVAVSCRVSCSGGDTAHTDSELRRTSNPHSHCSPGTAISAAAL